MSHQTTIKTLAEAEAAAAAAGVVLTPNDRNKIAKIQQAVRDNLSGQEPAVKAGFVEKFNGFYPRFLEFLIGVGEVLLTLSQTMIVAFGIPVTLVLVLIVEQQRVVHGIELFESALALASFAATALVLLNLSLEFLIHYIEQKAGYEAELNQRWSLRIWWENFKYRVGWAEDWIAQELSPAQRFRSLQRLVTFTILALALAGSMKDVIRDTPGAWHEALISIATDSDLLRMSTWLGGLLFAAAAVLAAQGLSRYVAIKCAEILNRMETQASQEAQPGEAETEAAAAQYIMARVAQYQQRQADKREQANPVNFTEQPTSQPVYQMPLIGQTPNGNGNAHNGNGHTGN